MINLKFIMISGGIESANDSNEYCTGTAENFRYIIN